LTGKPHRDASGRQVASRENAAAWRRFRQTSATIHEDFVSDDDPALGHELFDIPAEPITRSFWAGAYYPQQRAKGCSRQAPLRALAFKWIRVRDRCWQTRTPCDESLYLNVLKRRGSPVLSSIAEAATNT